MVKILETGLTKQVDDETLCCDPANNLMRIGDAKVGDQVFVTNSQQTKDELVEILGRSGQE